MIARSQPIQLLASDPTTQFTTALAQNYGEDESLTGLNSNNGMIVGIVVTSKDNLAWEVSFYSADTFTNVVPGTDKYVGGHRFAATDGKQDANIGSGACYKYSAQLELPYRDDDAVIRTVEASQDMPELHVRLVNRSASGKTDQVKVIVLWQGHDPDA